MSIANVPRFETINRKELNMKIIHGSYAEPSSETTTDSTNLTEYKKCPVCGAVCFADMDICFGCLHKFRADDSQVVEQQVQAIQATQAADSGQNGGEVTSHHVCAGKDGQEFVITISIKML